MHAVNYIYLLAAIASFVLTYLVREIAIRKAVLDIPNERSSHTVPTPRGGGLAIVLTWYGALIYFYTIHSIERDLLFAFCCGLLITIISLFDDIFGVNYKIRLTGQFVASAGALYFLGGLQKFDLGFYIVNQPLFLTLLAFVAMVWFINIFNFIDGIDGYAATETVFISLSIFSLFADKMMLILACATFGFLLWNWQRAKIFMGDVGSTMLGFTFSVFAIWYQNHNIAPITVWIVLTALFWFDATLTLFRRFKNKERLSQAHKKHAYQRIVQAGFSHGKTVMWSIVINVFLLIMTICLIQFNDAGLIFLAISVCVLYLIVKLIDKKKLNHLPYDV